MSVLLLAITSCVKTEDPTPVIKDSSFTIPEHTANDILVGTLTISNKESKYQYQFEIIDGNALNGFSIDNSTGEIHVNDSFVLDYETTPSFSLLVKVTITEKPEIYSEVPVTINLTDVIPVTTGLISFYKFNANGTDQTGFANAHVTSGFYTIDPAFPNEQVLSLSGNGYADLNQGFDYNQKSLSLWFKATSISSSMTVIFNNDYSGNIYGLTSLGVKEISGQDYLEFNFCGVSFYAPISINQWYHAVEVFDNKLCTYYLNDKVVYSSTATSYLSSSEGYPNCVVGANRYFDRLFSGYIRYVKIYSKALSAEEVHTLYAE